MPPITALLHTENDALRLGRCLETLYPCDDVLVVDHGSRDATAQVARAYGARVVAAELDASPRHYLRWVGAGSVGSESLGPASARLGWILCLDPRESLTENLAASLFEWKALSAPAPAARAFSVFLREETPEGWLDVPAAQTRLVPPSWNHWQGTLPVNEPSALVLEGELLRFVFP